MKGNFQYVQMFCGMVLFSATHKLNFYGMSNIMIQVKGQHLS